jgi:hypothetical protein
LHVREAFRETLRCALRTVRMGFLAFTMDIKMSMPRVATTMLALVSLTHLRNSVVATLPTSGNMSWLEERKHLLLKQL